jgi:hypothetical protein
MPRRDCVVPGSEGRKIIPVTSLTELLKIMKARGCPLEAYGVAIAKTLDHLWDEIESGETVLVETEDSIIMRLVGVLSILVRFGDSVLIEEKQTFRIDGRTRVRDWLWGHSSVSEKLLPGEVPREAVARAISEELGIQPDGYRIVSQDEPLFENFTSTTYPGLVSQYFRHSFIVELAPEAYRDTYEEHQGDKTVFFGWRPSSELRK